jgi:hypothetical protein
MPEISDQYAAGWIEARGRLQTNVGGRERVYRPQIRVTSTTLVVTEALQEHFGLGKTETFTPRKAPNLTLYAWEVRGPAAIETLERTVPYMISDIREHVEYILEREYSRPGKKEEYTQ